MSKLDDVLEKDIFFKSDEEEYCLESHQEITIANDDEVEKVAAQILAKHIKAFEELAK
ncbi:MAG: hypothetical protein FWE37_00055 [Spirochaetaceae bacterium]|nr:hypothetical protein [Spirochaetaceae bacterium]